MKREEKLVHGSGNVLRDFGWSNADAEQFKVILATEIIKALDRERLTVRRRTCPDRHRRGRFLSHSQCRSRTLHG